MINFRHVLSRCSRWIHGTAVFLVLAKGTVFSQTPSPLKPLPRWAQPVILYLDQLEKPTDGGYGWRDLPRSHASAVYAVIGSYNIIGRPPPRRSELIRYLKENQPLRGKNQDSIAFAGPSHTIDFHRLQALAWLGADLSDQKQMVAAWSEPLDYPSFYERSRFVELEDLAMYIRCRTLVGLNEDGISEPLLNRYSKSRRSNGTFNNTVFVDGTTGHVVNTLWGLWMALDTGRPITDQASLIQWLRDTQGPDGGFMRQPNPDLDASEDLYYTWAAVQSLRLCGGEVRKPDDCVDFVLRHWHEDGGFGWYPGGEADPLATFYALETLQTLNALEQLVGAEATTFTPPPIPPQQRVWSAQIGAPGLGSPSEMVELARSLRIHLWAGRFDTPGLMNACQELAQQQGVRVTFAKVEYDFSTSVHIPGLGAYKQISMAMLPAQPDDDNLPLLLNPSWHEYVAEHMDPLKARGAKWFWNVCDNELYSRVLLNESVASGAYAGINLFHFGGWNLLVNLPWLRAYDRRIPFVSLQNANGSQPWWWSDELTSHRTLFLAENPDWGSFVEALRNQQVAAVRHDGHVRFETWLHGGSEGVREFMMDHTDHWAWWEDLPSSYRRPSASIAIIRPEDYFESPRPETGRLVRLRTWWRVDVLGRPVKPVTELVQMTVDGLSVEPVLVEVKDIHDKVIDVYYRHDILDPTPGKHTVHVILRNLRNGRLSTMTRVFDITGSGR